MSGIGTKSAQLQPNNSFEYVLSRAMQLLQSYVDENQSVENYLADGAAAVIASPTAVAATARVKQEANTTATIAVLRDSSLQFANYAWWGVKEFTGYDNAAAKIVKINAFKELIGAVREDMRISELSPRQIIGYDTEEELEDTKQGHNVTKTAAATSLNKLNAVHVRDRLALIRTHIDTARTRIKPSRRVPGDTIVKGPGKSAAILDIIEAALKWLDEALTLKTFVPVLTHEIDKKANSVIEDLSQQLTKIEIDLLSHLFRLLFEVKFDELQAIKKDITGYSRKVPPAFAEELYAKLPVNINSLDITRVNNKTVDLRINQLDLIILAMQSLVTNARDAHTPYSYGSPVSYIWQLSITGSTSNPTYEFFENEATIIREYRERLEEFRATNDAARAATQTDRARGKLTAATDGTAKQKQPLVLA